MTARRLTVHFGSKLRPLYLALPILAGCLAGGCTTLEGVNVGANIPIGGPVSVGMNKTITAPAPKQTSQTSQTSQTQPPPPQTPVIAEKPDDQQASTSPD